MDAMQEETLVRRLSRRLPDRLFPLHYTITVGELNQAAKGQLVTGMEKNRLKFMCLMKTAGRSRLVPGESCM